MTTVNPDIDAISAEPTEVTLISGLPIRVNRIRTRATMALLKILTRGAGDVLASIRFTEDSTQEEFTGQLLGAVILSIPEAVDETIEFINLIVEPAQKKSGLRLSAGDRAWNEDLEIQLAEQLEDPELEDLITIVSEVVRNESEHVIALGKQLQALLPVAKSVTEKEASKAQTSATARTRTSTARKKAVASSKSASEG